MVTKKQRRKQVAHAIAQRRQTRRTRREVRQRRLRLAATAVLVVAAVAALAVWIANHPGSAEGSATGSAPVPAVHSTPEVTR